MTAAITGNEAAGSVDQGNRLYLKDELADAEMDIGPTVLQHMDTHYRRNQRKMSGTCTEENVIADEGNQMLCNSVKDKSRGSRAQLYRCDQCLKPYKSKNGLKIHCISEHGSESHKCTKCNSEYSCKHYLLKHVRIVHSERRYKCASCKKNYKSKEALKKHFKRHHGHRSTDSSKEQTQLEQQAQSQLYKCDKCLKTYKSKRVLKTHRRCLHGKKSHKCTECNTGYKCKEYLAKHMRKVHSQQQYACTVCSKICKSKEALYCHAACCYARRSAAAVARGLTSSVSKTEISHTGMEEQRGVGSKNEAAGSMSKEGLLHIKEEPADTDLDIGPTTLQDMDTYHGTNQTDCNVIKQENTIRNVGKEEIEDNRVLCSQVKDDIIMNGQKYSVMHRGLSMKKPGNTTMCLSLQSLSLKVHKERLESVCRVLLPRLHTFQCEVCDAQEMHESGSQKCSQCKSEHKATQSLYRYREPVHDSKGEHRCSTNNAALAQHNAMTFAKGAVPLQVFICDACDKTFKTKRAIRSHMKCTHGTSDLICSECDKHFKCKQYLKIHMMTVHGPHKHKCELCEKVFKCKKLLHNHVRCVHGVAGSSSALYTCDYCLKKFHFKTRLMTHIECVHGDNSYRCKECKKNFKCRLYLLRHMERVHGNEEHKCQLCERIFRSKQYLLTHVYRVHRPLPIHTCDYCKKDFKNKTSLRQHTLCVHTTGTYKCDECNKDYKSEICLSRHKSTVHVMGEHACEFCRKIFKAKPLLSNHVRYVHRKSIVLTHQTE